MSKNQAFWVTWISGAAFALFSNSIADNRTQSYLIGIAQGLFSSSIVILFIKEKP